MAYAELHCHTNYSFLDGASWPHDLVERASELGYEALAITDHDGFYGAAQTHLAAEEIRLPVVYGAEIGMPRGFDEAEPAMSHEPSALSSSSSGDNGVNGGLHQGSARG